MARWKALLHADGFDLLVEGAWAPGAVFTTLFVEAGDAVAAAQAARTDLAEDLARQSYVRWGPAAVVRAESVTRAGVLEGRFAPVAYAFYDPNEQ